MLEVLDQHHPTARTVASLGASAVSAHLDPAWRTRRLSRARLRRAALISAVVAAPLALILGPVGYGIWQDSYWHPATDENLLSAAFSARSAGRTLTAVVDRAEMSANSGRDTIFDWPVTGAGTLGPVTTAARDVADSQPFIAPGDRTVLGSPNSGLTWHAWALP